MKVSLKSCHRGVRIGFTLIELLIVIAIIGILAGVVLISIGGQTDSAKDAVKRAEASQLTSLAAFYASTNGGSYEGICQSNTFTEGDGKKILTSLANDRNIANKYSTYHVRVTKPYVFFYYQIGGSFRIACTSNDKFALYWATSATTLGCVDSQGSIRLDVPESKLSPVRINVRRRGFSFSNIPPQITNILCE